MLRQQAESLLQADADTRHLRKLVAEREHTLQEYEQRLQRARGLIEERDREVAECKTQAHDMYEKYADERERAER